jgi:mannosyltransferase
VPQPRERALLVRLVPPAVLLVLGLIQLFRGQPLWYDEAYSRLAAGVPLTTLLSGVWHRAGVVSYLMDVPPSFNAPYYVLLHFWSAVFGFSEFALRLPSLLTAAAAVGVLAELVRRQAGTGAGLLCGLLCATGPLLLDEAAQARDYGPAMLALALCALWFFDWLGGAPALLRVGIAAASAGLLHWFTLPVLVAFAVAAVVLRGRAGIRMALTLAAGCLPAALLVGWSFAGGTAGAPSPPAVGLLLPAYAIRDWSEGFVWLSYALVLAAVAGLWRGPRRTAVLCWIVVPMALITGVELLRPTYFARYLLFALVGLVVAAALGVAALRSRRLRIATGTLLVALSLVAVLGHVGDAPKEPSPAAIRLLAAEQQAGQPIVPADGRVSVDLETYLAGAPRLAADIVLPPVQFTDQTSSTVVWLVRVVLKTNSLPVVAAEQRLKDAGWTMASSTLLTGSNTDLRVERWVR